jgi:hypothetical protein
MKPLAETSLNAVKGEPIHDIDVQREVMKVQANS